MANALQVRRIPQIYLVIQTIQMNDLCCNTSAKLPFKCWIIRSSDKLFISELQLSTAHFSQHSFKTVFFFLFFFLLIFILLSVDLAKERSEAFVAMQDQRAHWQTRFCSNFAPPKIKKKKRKKEIEKERNHSYIFISCRWLIFICNCQAYHNAKLESRVHQLVLASEPLNPMGLTQKDRRLYPELAGARLSPFQQLGAFAKREKSTPPRAGGSGSWSGCTELA